MPRPGRTAAGGPALRAGREKRPLLVTGLYGPGRIAYMGFNGTWRWRRIGADAAYYEKFWLQTVNYLIAGRDQRGSNRGYIDIVKDSWHKGDQIKVEAEIFTTNSRSMALVEGLGMQLEGTIRSSHLKRGEWVDAHLYGILRDEWKALRSS